MKKILLLIVACFMAGPALAGYKVEFDFETSWTGDYAPGWVNAAYRHGPAPIGEMMQQTTTAHSGNYGMKLTATSVPHDWMWWASVEPENVNGYAMQKQFDPYFSAWYYDDGAAGQAGQIYSVPSWVNPYISGSEDWTDTQLGARYTVTDNYYYVAAGENSPGWQDTGVGRSTGWHQLKMQLSSADGFIKYYIDGVFVGQSYRNDYEDLITLGLHTMFEPKLGDWGSNQPYTIWDDVEFGSAYVPAPGAILLAGLGTVLAGRVRRFAK
ncbi:MAG: hypothetical protein MI892_26975 [Desulfobacterales bacterium]|nr:hypothetical protein [Desulfobacterales bacterium]